MGGIIIIIDITVNDNMAITKDLKKRLSVVNIEQKTKFVLQVALTCLRSLANSENCSEGQHIAGISNAVSVNRVYFQFVKELLLFARVKM